MGKYQIHILYSTIDIFLVDLPTALLFYSPSWLQNKLFSNLIILLITVNSMPTI